MSTSISPVPIYGTLIYTETSSKRGSSCAETDNDGERNAETTSQGRIFRAKGDLLHKFTDPGFAFVFIIHSAFLSARDVIPE
jgi:hypothetical protein